MHPSSVVRCGLAAAVFAACATARAGTIDIVPYMGLTPGKWSILQSDGGSWQSGVSVTSGANGQVLKNYWYRSHAGAAWTPDGASNVFEITPTELRIVGLQDGADAWVFDPTPSLPRPLTVNKPYFFSTNLKHPATGEKSKMALLVIVTKTGIAVSTPAGSFTGCIKMRFYSYGGGESEEDVNLDCKGRSDVQTWFHRISDTADPQQESQDGGSTQLIQYGNKNPPFP